MDTQVTEETHLHKRRLDFKFVFYSMALCFQVNSLGVR